MGMVLPFILLIRSKGTNIKMMFTASGLMTVGIFFMRYDLVLAGQIVPVFHALQVEEYNSLLPYTPSLHEIGVLIGWLAFAAAAFLVGERMLNGHQFQKHGIVPPGAYACPGCGGIHYKKEGETEEEALQRHHPDSQNSSSGLTTNELNRRRS